MALPDSMRFIEHGEGGDPGVMRVARGPLPQPKPEEVLIRVLVAGVNRPDVAQRQGSYPPPPGASPVLGLEAAGEAEVPVARLLAERMDAIIRADGGERDWAALGQPPKGG